MVIDQPFASFMPDLPALNSPGAQLLHNCSIGLGSSQGAVTAYPLKSGSLYSNTSMQSRPLGSAVGQDRLGAAKVYGFCAEKAYKLEPSTRQWTDISRSGGYTTTGTERVKSIEFGSYQITTNYNDPPSWIDMNVDLTFADLTTLVRGRHIATFKGFVMLGNTYDALDGAVPHRLRWSGIENPHDWTFSPATMADFQDFHNMGAIQGLVTDDSLWIILQRGIIQGSFAGPPLIFQFDQRVTGIGCSVPETIVSAGSQHFFLSDSGWYMLQGGQLTPIGQGIDRWFLETADLTQAHLWTTSVDPKETLIVWNYVSEDAENGKPDKQLIYNYSTRQWSTADATTSFIYNSMSLAWTLDMLDQFGTIDDVPASFDSPLWAGGKQLLFGMSETGAIYSFSGPTMQFSYESPELHLPSVIPNETGADIAIIDSVRPRFEGSTAVARVQVGTKRLPNDEIDWGELKETHPETGRAYTRKMSRYSQFRVTISGDWTKASGLQIDAKTAGRR